MVDIQSATAENLRIGEEKEQKKKEETTAAKDNGLPYWAAIISYYHLRYFQCATLFSSPFCLFCLSITRLTQKIIGGLS